MAIFMLAAAIPIPVLAQVVVVQGRVFEFGSRTVIANARVELEGYGATLSTIGGTFRFEGVEPGEYTLQVDGLGYDSETQVITVTDGVIPVLVPLRIAPIAIDSLLVDLRRIDIKGRVRDAERDLFLVDAEIFTDQIPGTLTDANGRFKLENVLEGVPLRVVVRPYGYLRMDTVFVPDKDETYVFEPVPDPWVEGMIAEQVARIEERGAGLGYRRPPMNRDRLLRYAGSFTLLDALEIEFRNRDIAQIPCVIVDERREEFLPVGFFLQTTLPEELERVELLFSGDMLRIYTREFMQYMFDTELELRAPVWVPGAGICF
jgi:hypothetical protein